MKALMGAVLVTVLVAAGCTSGSKTSKPNPPATGSGGSTLPGPPAKTLASAIGDFAGGQVDVYGLKRSGDSLRLDFGVTNSGSTSVPLISSMDDPGFNNPFTRNVSGVTLLDTPHAKEYRVLLNREDRSCRCSDDLGYVDKGKTVRLFADFPLPPPELKTLHVVVPHYTPMLGVAIDGSGAGATATPSLTPKPAATAPGTGDATGVNLEVYELQRADGLSVLRLGLHNTGSEIFQPGDKFQAPERKGGSAHNLTGAALVDPTAQQKYLPLTDSTGYCLCSGKMDFDASLDPGTTDVYWVGFPSPPPAVTSMQVLVPNFAPLSVPVTGK